MRHLTTTMAVAMSIVFGIGCFSRSSTASGKNDSPATGRNDFYGIMHSMDNHYRMMSQNFNWLDKNLNQMMSMNNMSELRNAMHQHRQMMAGFQKNMMDQGSMWRHTMSKMGSMNMMGMMGSMEGESNFTGMMRDMDDHYQTMYGQFDSLKRNFDQMMNMNNMSQLKDAMGQHQQMMMAFHQSMMQQGDMWNQMMPMMGSHGMMGGQGSMMNKGMMGDSPGHDMQGEQQKDH
jgi:hypothetical protein